ncbi:MAG TPA: tetratricopeptide repeat protein [Azospirillum sp.]|nr:tetratricopeptide repeat protein [Azospirillum sp.]
MSSGGSVREDRLGVVLDLLRAGAPAEAARLCAAMLARNPAMAEGLASLALAHQQRGNAVMAGRLFDRALAVRPDYPEALANRAILRLLDSRADDALADATAAVRLNPALGAAHGLRARLLFARGDHAGAVEAARHALALGPARDELRYILVDALRRGSRWPEAEAAALESLRAAPGMTGLWTMLGLVRHALGRRAEAVEAANRALALEPGLMAAHVNRANSLARLRRREEAVTAFRRALVLDPANSEAALSLGSVLTDLGRWREVPVLLAAVRPNAAIHAPDLAHAWHRAGQAAQRGGDPASSIHAFRNAARLEPDNAAHHGQLASTLAMAGHHGEAVAAFRRALALAPGNGRLAANLATALVTEGRADEAASLFRLTLPFQEEPHKGHSNLLFARQYQPGVTPAQHRAEHRAWYERHAAGLSGPSPVFPNRPLPERRLRIGFVSADLGRHPVGYFLAPFLAAHDRGGFAVFCYSNRAQEDAMSAELKRHAEGWRRVDGLSDEDLAAAIRADAIDILVDLSGHTAAHRLLVFARRPAPVQVTWLGYVNTTGMPVIDGFIGGGVETPPGAESWFEERLQRLPEGRFCYRPPDEAPDVVPPPSAREGRVTFGSFNTLAKLSQPTVALWARVLAAVPGSRLVLKARPLGDITVRRRIRARFAAAGLEPDRLELRPWSPYVSMLAEYGDLDIALDPLPFSGGLTSCEALWMGVPVITWPSDTLASRQTAGFLTLIGLPELVADSPGGYVEAARALARDPDRLAALRAGMRARMRGSPLLDGPRFARALEAALRRMWRDWCRNAGEANAGKPGP